MVALIAQVAGVIGLAVGSWLAIHLRRAYRRDRLLASGWAGRLALPPSRTELVALDEFGLPLWRLPGAALVHRQPPVPQGERWDAMRRGWVLSDGRFIAEEDQWTPRL